MMEFLIKYPWALALVAIWTVPWKGVALWMAAQRKQSVWFVLILIFNTLGILEILYILFFSKEKEIENNKCVEKVIRRI